MEDTPRHKKLGLVRSWALLVRICSTPTTCTVKSACRSGLLRLGGNVTEALIIKDGIEIRARQALCRFRRATASAQGP